MKVVLDEIFTFGMKMVLDELVFYQDVNNKIFVIVVID